MHLRARAASPTHAFPGGAIHAAGVCAAVPISHVAPHPAVPAVGAAGAGGEQRRLPRPAAVRAARAAAGRAGQPQGEPPALRKTPVCRTSEPVALGAYQRCQWLKQSTQKASQALVVACATTASPILPHLSSAIA